MVAHNIFRPRYHKNIKKHQVMTFSEYNTLLSLSCPLLNYQ